MTVDKAYELLVSKMPKFRVTKCIEYKSVFVFQLIPESMQVKEGDTIMNCQYSVNKKTSEIQSFLPFHIPLAEYKNGKEIKDFK